MAVDFDGTIAEVDVTDTVLNRFARREWLAVEELWVNGAIGSRECLTRQIGLVEADLATVLSFVSDIAIDSHFGRFVDFVGARGVPWAIISDGFAPFIQRILSTAGHFGLPIFANLLQEENGRLKALFPQHEGRCQAGTCKCAVADRLRQGSPVVLVGDGGSDFCLAKKASFVFAKDKLAAFCREKGIAHAVYDDLGEVIEGLGRLDLAALEQV